MASSSARILITAATGTQSSALIRTLSAQSSSTSTPMTIHATTRNPAGGAAQALLAHAHEHLTIQLFPVDFNDPASLVAPATGVTHAFLNVTPVFSDLTLEAQHARHILAALETAARDTLRRLVYTSAASVAPLSTYRDIDNFPTMKAYFTQKHGIELAVASFASTSLPTPIDHTILHPGTFLTNFLPPLGRWMYPNLQTEHTITTALDEHLRMAWVDPTDIGRFAAAALTGEGSSWEDGFRGRIVPVAGVNATLGQVVDSINAALAADPAVQQDVRVRVEYVASAEARAKMGSDLLVERDLFQNANSVDVDTEAVAAHGLVALGDLGAFWRGEEKRLREAVGVE